MTINLMKPKHTLFKVLFVLACFGQYQAKAISIWQARKAGAGATVTVNGIVLNGSEYGNVRYISDGTSGICLFGSALSTVNKGDSITATGTLVNYNDLLEMSPVSSFTVLATNRTLPTPIPAEPWHMNEYNEGSLVKLYNASFATPTGVFTGNNSYSLYSNGNSFVVYVKTGNPLVGQPIPTGVFSITGVCSEFSTVYQLLPRGTSDVASQNLYATSGVKLTASTASSLSLDLPVNASSYGFAKYGLTPALELGTVASSFANNIHSFQLTGLQAARQYYVQCYAVNGTDTAWTVTHVYSTASSVAGSVKVWFNRPVDNTKAVPAGNNAVRLTGSVIADSIVNILNKANLTIDVAMYNFATGTVPGKIVTALNNAVGRGVVVRYIYDNGSQNLGLPTMSSGIYKVSSPVATSDGYNIMHNKFLVIDANSSTPANALAVTGSTNFTTDQLNSDANNVEVIRDQAVARAYRDEFNEMWGGSQNTADTLASRFGFYKKENTAHDFFVGGKHVEVYFSPSDNTEGHIRSNMLTAGSSLYFANLIFTQSVLANAVNSVFSNGAICVGLVNDTTGSDPTAFLSMKANLGTNLQLYDFTTQAGILHHKYCIVDQATASDPLVMTGSHNYTWSANNRNDENMILFHDADVANQFYQEFVARFNENGGALSVDQFSAPSAELHIYPVPADHLVSVVSKAEITAITLYSLDGKVVEAKKQGTLNRMEVEVSALENGVYVLKVDTKSGQYSGMCVVQHP